MMTKNRARMALVTAAMIAVGALSSTVVAAGQGPQAKPNLRHAVPLHGHNPLLKITGDNGDDDTAIAPTLSALCQSYIGGSNPYNNPAPNVDMINGDNIVLAGSQTGCSTPQNETTIDVNPSNPLNLVGGTNDYRVFNTRENRNDGSGWAYATFDGGASWAKCLAAAPHHSDRRDGRTVGHGLGGRPVVALGPHNTVYYANLLFSRLNRQRHRRVQRINMTAVCDWGEPSIVHTDGVDSNRQPSPRRSSTTKSGSRSTRTRARRTSPGRSSATRTRRSSSRARRTADTRGRRRCA